jgi:hypothetical protein
MPDSVQFIDRLSGPACIQVADLADSRNHGDLTYANSQLETNHRAGDRSYSRLSGLILV